MNKVTLENLAVMIKKGFDDVDKRFEENQKEHQIINQKLDQNQKEHQIMNQKLEDIDLHLSQTSLQSDFVNHEQRLRIVERKLQLA